MIVGRACLCFDPLQDHSLDGGGGPVLLGGLPGLGAIRGYPFCGLYLFLLFVRAGISLCEFFYPFEYKG
jgi:hypothetical protein